MGSLLAMVVILALDLPQPLVLGREPVEITLVSPGDAELRRRVDTIAGDSSSQLVLRVQDLEADGEPGVSWEIVLVSGPSREAERAGSLVGVMSFFGPPGRAGFAFALDAAIAEQACPGLALRFRPVSGVEVDGKPLAPDVRYPLRIGGIRLELEPGPSP